MEPGAPVRRTRRIFLADLGKAAIGLAVLGAACSDDAPASSTTAAPTTSGPVDTTSPSTDTTSTSTTAAATSAPTTTQAAPSGVDVAWERIALGSVSAYVVVRSGEAVLVDTGNRDSEDSIGATLDALGLGWDAVAHVILTHRHPDHIGSVDAVMTAAAAAAAYAGAEDIPSINAPRPVTAVADGDMVAGLEIIATPGHTAGHVAVLDRNLSVLVAGDALIGDAGGVAGPVPAFTEDEAMAAASVAKLATFEFDTVLFGHGEPVLAGGSALVGELAEEL